MSAETDHRPVLPVLLATAAFVVIVAGMRTADSIIVPFLLAIFIAILAAPPLFWLQAKGLPKGLALLAVVLGIAVIGMTLVLLLGNSVDGFVRSVPEYQAQLQERTAGMTQWLREHGINLPDKFVKESFDPGTLMQLIGKAVSGLGSVLANAFFILLTVIFILLEASSFPAKMRSIVADPEQSQAQFRRMSENVQRYIAIKTWVSIGTGIFVAVWLAVIGVEYAVLWGLITFLLNYVPNIGSILAGIPPFLLGFVLGGMPLALLAAGGQLVANTVFGNIIEPRFMGRGLGLSTLVVFLSLVFWGWVFGPVGMLLSVPLTMVVKIALEANPETHWVAVLLGPESEAEAPPEDAGEQEA